MSILRPYKAYLFDLNGTMIDDMAYHVQAWSSILNDDLGAGLDYETLKAEMYGKNDELLVRIFGEARFSDVEMKDLSMEKERRYQAAFYPTLKLIDGLPRFLDEAKQKGIKMAIGSAAIPFNIDFVLDNLQIRHYFDVIVSADDVMVSKPHPDTYLKCASQLGVNAPECVVFEDAPKGVEAAQNAGMKCVVLTTMHDESEFRNYHNIIRFIADFNEL